MSETPEYLGLEQKCLSPGVWLIEGHEVRRFKQANRQTRWSVDGRGAHLTLAECREFISRLVPQGWGE